MSKRQNITLAGFDDIFSTAPKSGESVRMIELTQLFAPDPHPFLVTDDDAMSSLVESIKRDGVMVPGIARIRAEGGYELLSGSRRRRACEIAGLSEMPVIVRELTDNQAVLAMVDSNLLSREKLLPSEKAWAYRYRMEALNHNGIKGEQNSCDIMSAQTGECKTQIYKTICLTELVDALLDKVDTKGLAFSPAVELSALSYDEQHYVADCMAKYEVKPSLAMAVKLRKAKQDGSLTHNMIDDVLSRENIAEPHNTAQQSGLQAYKKYFPSGYTERQINDTIITLLKAWKSSAGYISDKSA